MMKLKTWKVAGILLWGGAALIILGLALSYPRLAPYVSAAFARDPIPTAPPLTFDTTSDAQVQTVKEGSAKTPEASEGPEEVLLPFEEDDLEGTVVQEDGVGAASVPPPVAPSTPGLDDADPTSAMPAFVGTIPVNIRIPAINLDAPVTSIGWEIVTRGGKSQALWQVPNRRAAGWHNTSALLGIPGNTVLNGHNTGRGEVFRDLYKLDGGEEIVVDGQDGQVYTYEVDETYILPEAGQPVEVRRQNARYIQQTPDERLTLVTCHPYGSLANRLLIIAYPVSDGGEAQGE
jgi:LPXTG-site transpeptidase (sortase) family protein